MPSSKSSQSSLRVAGISDDAVKKATGKTWSQWLTTIDGAGGRTKSHKELVSIAQRSGAGPWWGQMVAVGYEQARGLRNKHQTATGYSISRSKTIAAPIARMFNAWTMTTQRKAWLKGRDIHIRKATANRSLRINWGDESANVEVMFYPRGTGKTAVTVQHRKLATAKEAERMKRFWGQALERLAKVLTVKVSRRRGAK